MRLRLEPDPGPALARALASLLERERLLDAPTHGDAWRSAAFREGVAREPGLPRGSELDCRYVAAPSPRRTRGATRA